MPSDIVLKVVARKDSKDLVALAAEFEALKKEVDDNSKSLQKNASFSKFLDDQIAKTKVQVKQLGEEFDRTGNKDVFANLKGAEKNLKSLENIQKQLTKSISTGVDNGVREGFQEGLKTASASSQGFLSNPEIGPILVGGIVAAIVAASPAIGAALNGILLGGVGFAGIGAAIVGQIKSPEVSTALDELKTTGEDVLTSATKAFAPILVDAAHNFSNDLLRAEPKLANMFDRLAPHAANLFAGLEGLGAKAAPGFFEALDAAGPILDQIGRDLPELGHAFSTFFHSIADGAPGAKDALHDLFLITETTIEGVGYLVEGLSKAFTVEEAFGQLLRGDVGGAGVILGDLATNSHSAADGMKGIIDAFKRSTDPAAILAGQLERLNGGLSTLIGNQLAVDGANDAFQRGLNDLGQQLDRNNLTLQGNSDAALTNRNAIEQLIQQAEQAREAQIKMAGGADASKTAIDQANKSYQDAITRIETVGTQAGLSKKQLDDLAGRYDINVVLAVDQINNSPLAQLTHAHDPGRYGSAGPPKRARGGPVSAGMPYIVGDGGVPELFVPSVSGAIIPKVPSGPSSRTWSGGGATVTFAGDTNSAFATAFMQLVRTGVIQIN